MRGYEENFKKREMRQEISKGSSEFQEFKTRIDPLILQWKRANDRKDWTHTRKIEEKISQLLPKPVKRADLLVMIETLRNDGEKSLNDISKRGGGRERRNRPQGYVYAQKKAGGRS